MEKSAEKSECKRKIPWKTAAEASFLALSLFQLLCLHSLRSANTSAEERVPRQQLQTVWAVCPMQSIIDDQIAEARSMEVSAASVADVLDGELRSAKFQLLFGSAEKIQYDNHFYFLDVFLTRCSAFATKLSKCLTAIPNTSVRR